jgi:hypothetical protein
VEEPQKDLRDAEKPLADGDETLAPMDPPEPLVVAPDELRQQYRDEYERMVEDEATRVYVHVAEYVKLKSYMQVLKFMGMHMRVYQDAQARKGYYGGGIRGRWWKKQFWTYSIWESREAVNAFLRGRPHGEAVDRMREFAAPGSCYVTWEALGASDWSGALSRLEHPTRYFVDPFFG